MAKLLRRIGAPRRRKKKEAEASNCWDGSVSGMGAEDRLPGRPSRPSDGKRPDWDASTACGDDRLSVDRDTQSAAERLLDANPQMRAIHSKGSVQRLMEKAQDTQSGHSVS